MVTKVMSRIFITLLQAAQAASWLKATMVVKMNPRRVALPTTMAKGKLRAKPQLMPWGTKYATPYHPRMPIQGRRRNTGTSPRQIETKRMSLTPDPRAEDPGCPSLLHRDALGEVARLIHVTASEDGHVVGQELKRDDGQERREELGGRGDGQHVIGPAAHLVIAAIADGDDLAAPRAHFLDVAHHAVVARVSRSEGDDRHPLVDERDGPVLHLAGGVAFRVDVGDLLELERSLEGDRILQPAAEEEEVTVGSKLGGESGHRPPGLECLRHEAGELGELGQTLLAITHAEEAFVQTEGEGHQIGGGHRGRKGLSGGDADLGTGMRVDHPIGLSRECRPHYVGDGEDGSAPLASRLDRPEGICGLPRL